jgi:hypothetical protein
MLGFPKCIDNDYTLPAAQVHIAGLDTLARLASCRSSDD